MLDKLKNYWLLSGRMYCLVVFLAVPYNLHGSVAYAVTADNPEDAYFPTPTPQPTPTYPPVQCPPPGYLPGQCQVVVLNQLSQTGPSAQCSCCPGNQIWGVNGCTCEVGFVLSSSGACVTPTPTPCPNDTQLVNNTCVKCQYKVHTMPLGTAHRTDVSGALYGWGDYTARIPIFQGAQLSCLSSLLSAYGSSGYTSYYLNGWGIGQWNDDDYIAQWFYRQIPGQDYAPVSLFWGFVIGPFQSEHTLYMDKDCRYLGTEPSGPVCDELNVRYVISPVSLNWTADADVNEVKSISQFPLNPSDVGKWYSWKASAQTPLVVWDPSHEGSIHSATQLFGEHTFGKSWQNGYLALASLDHNGDDKLSGDELDGLALWFDEESDGVSAPGEVVDVIKAGVTELFFKGGVSEGQNRDIHLNKGFTRRIDKSTITGSSVDWYGEVFDSPSAAISDFQHHATQKSRYSITNSADTIHSDTAISSSASERSSFAGTWIWSVDQSQGLLKKVNAEIGNGVLTIQEAGQYVSGHSYSEVAFDGLSRGEMTSAIHIRHFLGQIITDKSGNERISFEIEGKNGWRTNTTAYLTNDGTILNGLSVGEIGIDKNGKPLTLSYNWTARKIKMNHGKMSSVVKPKS